MTKLTPYFIIAILALIIFSGIAVQRCSTNKDNSDRQAGNLQTIRDSVQFLEFTNREFKNTEFKNKDSIKALLKANKLLSRNIRQVTVYQTEYKDTGSVRLVYKEIIKQPDSSYRIPVSFTSLCWSMKAQILTRDSLSKLDILERSANNKASVIITKQRRFLWILWVTHKPKVIINSQCGPIQITDLKFVKK